MADSEDSWRSDLGFTERSTATLELITAFKKADLPASEHLALARATESHCFASATCLDHYHSLLASELQQLLPGPTHHIAPHLPPPSRPPIGEYINPILEETTLSSNIYKAEAKDGRLVCLKLSQASQPQPHNAVLEAKILESVKGGPHILEFLETFKHRETASLVLVTPWLPYNYTDFLTEDAGKRLSVRDTKSILYQIAEALEFIHGKDIIHRDLKPSNIMLSSLSPPIAHLIDFSISWSPSSPEPASQKTSQIGTTWFRAPELLFGSQVYTSAVDMWAFGCILAQSFNANCEPIFEAGELGTELTLIASLFRTLGTPDEESWPECRTLPDWGKVEFVRFEGRGWEEIVVGSRAGREVWELCAGLCRWESGERLRAEEVRPHGFFDEVRGS